ncbi:MAG: hypothetical protein JXQ91_07555 [Vannielia sp.]|uniref:hypothetical protein n=1 Tax=Vannielia sp. TaxID=2813045 RepID=UPI003B8B5DD3
MAYVEIAAACYLLSLQAFTAVAYGLLNQILLKIAPVILGAALAIDALNRLGWL